MTAVSNWAELLDDGFDVARRLREFDSYGGNAATARRALERRRPGFSKAQYAEALEKALLLFDSARDFVEQNIATFWDEYSNEFPNRRSLRAGIKARCRGFAARTYDSALWWCFYWHHLK